MKRIITSAALFLFVWGQAQIVNIPDPAFKAILLAASPTNPYAHIGNNPVTIDTNGDGEIQVSEAAVIQSLGAGPGISSLTGIEAFSGLETLSVSDNNLTTIDISNLPLLGYLYCSNNALTEIVGLDSATNLIGLHCENNQLTSINAFNMTSLQGLYCDHNQLHELILPNKPDAPYVIASYNQLTNIDFSYVNQLGILEFDHNLLTSIDFNGPTLYTLEDGAGLNFSNNPLTHIDMDSFSGHANAELLSLSDTLITELSLPPNIEFSYLYISNNPNLQFLSVKDYYNLIFFNNPELALNLSLANNPQLRYVCVDDNYSYSFIQSRLSYNQNILYGSYCSFTPGGNYRTVTGNIRYDLNSDGCSAADVPAVQLPIKLVQSNQNLGTAFTNQNGNYAAYTSSGNLTLTPQLENPYFTVSPASFTSTFTSANQTQTADFCITPNGSHTDLQIALLPITPARPGFDAQYKIVYSNIGTTTQSGTVKFYFQDPKMNFVNANPSISGSSLHTVSWDFTDLHPLESREIVFTFHINSPVETPAVNPGDVLSLLADVNPLNDETYWNNTVNFDQTVVGSYDPNDKTVSVTNYPYDLSQVEDLFYTIRFQNLGTAAAENVVVSDVLSNKFNQATLRTVSSSHPCVVRYKASTRKLEYIFEGIQLPSASENEPGSHGYVTFRIKALDSGIAEGDLAENKADIYFDYNAPVSTNTTQTTFYSVLANPHFAVGMNCTMHPNPAQNQIAFSGTFSKADVEIYNLAGARLLQTSLKPQEALPLSLPAGMYLVKLQVDGQNILKKLMIK